MTDNICKVYQVVTTSKFGPTTVGFFKDKNHAEDFGNQLLVVPLTAHKNVTIEFVIYEHYVEEARVIYLCTALPEQNWIPHCLLGMYTLITTSEAMVEKFCKQMKRVGFDPCTPKIHTFTIQ